MAERKPCIAKAFSLPASWEKTKDKFWNTLATTVEVLIGSPSIAQHDDHSHDREEIPRVLVGPIIGKVTTSTVRILLEVDKDSYVTVVLFEDAEAANGGEGSGSSRSFLRRLGSSLSYSGKKFEECSFNGNGDFKVDKHLKAERPTVFKFEGLKAGTRHVVQVRCHKSVVPAVYSSFRTFPDDPAEVLSVGAISCNNIFVTKQKISSHSDLWAHLAKSIEARKIDLLVHMGDQIYGDGDKRCDAEAGHDSDKGSNRFHKAKEMLSGMGSEKWKRCMDTVCESYREVYRETWQHPPTAKCLANCSNLMIYDDHEIRDNWGDIEDDWKQDSPDFFIARCAWIVSLEYQRQLHEDVDFTNLQTIKKDYHFHIVSNVGLMFLDIRGSRTFHRVQGEKNPYLGSQQWEDIEKALGSGGLFDEVKMLVVCTPAPLVFLQTLITSKAANNVHRLEDFKGHWSVHQCEQQHMIKCLYEWKTAKEHREILILGGDVHCGGHSTIYIEKNIAFHQLTTSAIANRPLPKSVYYTLRLAEQLGRLTQQYTFTHHDWTRARNYGVVQIKNHRIQDKEEPDYTTQLVRAKYVGGIIAGVKINNRQKRKKALASAILHQCSCFLLTHLHLKRLQKVSS